MRSGSCFHSAAAIACTINNASQRVPAQVMYMVAVRREAGTSGVDVQLSRRRRARRGAVLRRRHRLHRTRQVDSIR